MREGVPLITVAEGDCFESKKVTVSQCRLKQKFQTGEHHGKKKDLNRTSGRRIKKRPGRTAENIVDENWRQKPQGGDPVKTPDQGTGV